MEEKKITHEKQDINYRGFIVSNILTGLFIAVVMASFLVLFFSYRDYRYKQDISSRGIDKEVEKVREYENTQLSSYGFLDKEKGIIRIPVEKAIEETIKDYNK